MLGRAVKRLAVGYLRRRPAARRHLLYLLREGYPGLPVISQSEYPVDSTPRYGYGRDAHPQLLEQIEAAFRVHLDMRDWALRKGAITLEESNLLRRRYEQGLSGYTYLVQGS